jgi:hypothetical protein
MTIGFLTGESKMHKRVEMQDTTPTEIIPFDAGVDEAMQILANIDKVTDAGHLRIGEIADKLETKYADRTLAKFAEAIGKSPSCVKRWRSVYRAWKDTQIGATWPQLNIPYSVLRELQDLPDREQLLIDDPKMTVREATRLKRNRANADKDKAVDASLNKYRKGFNAMCNRVGEAASWAESASKLSYAELDKAAQKIERLMFTNFVRDTKLLIKFCELMGPFVLDEEAGFEQEAADATERTQLESTIQGAAE